MTLVTRDHAKWTLEGARAALAAAQQRAAEIPRPMNIAVVDQGGHLLAFVRRDGAKLSSVRIAQVKARSAALRAAPTGPSMTGAQVDRLLSVALAIASPNEQTPIHGGVPLVVDGQVVGAIGVGAGTEDQDVDAAHAGAVALEKA